MKSLADGKEFEHYSKYAKDTILTEYFNTRKVMFPVLSYVSKDGHEELKVVDGHMTENLIDYRDNPLFRDSLQFPDTVIVSRPFQSQEINELVINLAMAKNAYTTPINLTMLWT